jgi:hypothetical protein
MTEGAGMTYAPEDPASPLPPVGHQISILGFLGDSMRLMAYVQAGSSVAAIWRGSEFGEDPNLAMLRSVFMAHQANEIPRLLVSVAAVLRAKIDDGSWAAADERVGWIASGTPSAHSAREALTVREACNKIMHAQDVKPVEHRDADGRQFIGALIDLVGERGEKQWCAELNLQAFCIALVNTDFYVRGGRPCEN